jgi:hypothetical protein
LVSFLERLAPAGRGPHHPVLALEMQEFLDIRGGIRYVVNYQEAIEIAPSPLRLQAHASHPIL